MSGREIIVLAGILLACLPILAAWLRHRSGTMLLVTSVASMAMALTLALVGNLLHLGPTPGVRVWVYLLVGSASVLMLAVYFFSAVLGREQPRESLSQLRRTWGMLGAFALLAILFLKDPDFISGYRWGADTGTVLFGAMGKAYLSYLLVGLVFIGYNLENTYRLAVGAARDRLRPVVFGLFGVLGFFTYVLTTGLLYSSVRLDNLIAATVPIGVASILTSYSFLRGTLTDASVPVSRNVVYSSFTAFVAALYVLAVGVAAQLASFTRWSPGQVVTVSFVFLVLLGAVTLGFSNRIQRRVRRFIDRNFYVNRYDYRTQWFRVTRSLDPSQGREGVLRSAASLLQEVLGAQQVSIGLTDRTSGFLLPRHGRGVGVEDLWLDPNSPLCHKLREERRSLLLDRQSDDLEYIPIYVENREWLENTASGTIAPLLAGQELLGVIGLERDHPDDPFTFEDLSLLDSMSAHLAAVLRSVELAEELSRAREAELLSQWSSMLLHDIKNYVSPLRLIMQNMRLHRDNPDFHRIATEDLSEVTRRMETLVERLGEIQQGPPRVGMAPVDMNGLVREVIGDLKLERYSELETVIHLDAERPAQGDASLLRRVIENLLTNAVEAMDGSGRLGIHIETPHAATGSRELLITVSDSGPGMDERFVRSRLFQPFATTKPQGLGLGLYQSRTIVAAHGGELYVDSRPGKGCTMQVVLQAAGRDEDDSREDLRIVPGRRPA